MSLAQVISAYIALNLLIVVGFLSLVLFAGIMSQLQMRIKSQWELKLHYWIFLFILAITAIHPFLPQPESFSPIAKVWSAPSLKNFNQDYSSSKQKGYLSVSTPLGASHVQVTYFSWIVFLLSAFLLMMGGFAFFKDLSRILQIQRQSFLIRKLGTVQIFINDHIQVPYSYWLPGQANIVVPSYLLARTEDYRIAVTHELQHHRHADTRWVYILWGIKWLCIINPAIHFWNYWISEIQEFACDETMVDQKKVDSQAYARCLLEVVQTAIHQKGKPVCATGLTFLLERNLLKRRIQKMFTKSSNQKGRSISIMVGLVITFIMATTAFAAKGFVQDRRVSLQQAQKMVLRAQSESGFPIVVNELVLTQLNRFIGTPEGRETMRNALAQMENHKELVADYLQKYGLPQEILALPLIESGYQNLPQQKNPAWPTWKAAGVWQFIRQTAINYGLVVNEKQDDRLNVELLTDAAMRYLQSNYLRFKDWHLAVLAYNMGENQVQKAMAAVGQRDAWALIQNGHEGDKNYLPKVMAAILILRNPESVK